MEIFKVFHCLTFLPPKNSENFDGKVKSISITPYHAESMKKIEAAVWDLPSK